MSNLRPTMELAVAPFRLLFNHPFGTAHGLRDGTDSVFVRLMVDGTCGYGEATLPPYIGYSQSAVIDELKSIELKSVFNLGQGSFLGGAVLDRLGPPIRTALTMAYIDLICSVKELSIKSYFQMASSGPRARAMVTLGHSDIDDIPLKLSALPQSEVLKVKLGAANDVAVLERLKLLDNRPLFLDANQGWRSLADAEIAIHAAGPERILGVEQPFAKDRWDLHKALKERLGIPVYGDESIQGPADLERAPEAFDGVNLKLVKCGGLDIAVRMAARARELGLKVMLGSMSESSLGSGAMFALADAADLLDLDGPWLIKNDPFEGLRMVNGRLERADPTAPGFGIRLRPGHGLVFAPVGG